MNDYILGLLYGDGYSQFKDGYEWYFFSTTHKEISDKVKQMLDRNDYNYFSHNRVFGKGHEKENYEILEIIEITDANLREFLIDNGFKSKRAEERIKINSDFLRGYLETKGTLFKSHSRGSEFWRVSFSGEYDDLSYIKDQLENKLDITFSDIIRRREREEKGIISQSYRVNIQNRTGVAKLLEYIEGEEISAYLDQRVKGFNHFHSTTPFNMKRKVFKHYKNAVNFMTRNMGIVIKGVRGGGGTRGFKPVYLWNDDLAIAGFKGWEDAYKWVSKEYKEQTGLNPPTVDNNIE